MARFTLEYVHTFYDARGKLRHVFRRKGHKRVTIKGKPGTPEFMERYHALLNQTSGLDVGASRLKAGAIDALILRYYQSDSFKALAKATQVCRRPILDRFRDFKTPSGRRYGDNKIGGMIQQDVAAVLEGKTPNAKKNTLKVLRHLIAFAITENECKADPTIGMKLARPAKSAGHMTWGDEQIAQYRERYANGTMARLALELMLNIAARRHDAHLIGRQHLRDGKLSWRPNKTHRTTGKLLTIRVLPELQASLDAMPPSDALTFLLTDHGRPFASAAAFGNKFADWVKAAGLQPVLCDDGRVRSYRAHGLRKAACMQLVHDGCNAMEVMAVSGHATLAQVQVYIDAVEQERMAEAAMAKRAARSKQAQAVANNRSSGG